MINCGPASTSFRCPPPRELPYDRAMSTDFWQAALINVLIGAVALAIVLVLLYWVIREAVLAALREHTTSAIWAVTIKDPPAKS